MADYIYLLENRLSSAQQKALGAVRNVVRSHDLTLFLTGGAVRDLTGGASVRDLDVTVQGDATLLRADLEAAGGTLLGENGPAKALYFLFPGGVRVEIGSSMAVAFPKPGKPEYTAASIIDDLRSRDFTANAMALSLNEGSYGLLMDPLNGVADIENRELRLVSNYGFIEDPSRLIRAVRLQTRLGWHLEERTQARYDTAKQEGYIGALSKWNRGYELEEIFHEEDPLRILRALEAEGWMEYLFPPLTSAKVNAAGLSDLADKQGQLHMQGILATQSALAFPLLTAKLADAEVESLKSLFARPGFARQIETLEERTRELQARFAGKEASQPSTAWKMLHEAEPELVLSMAFSAKAAGVQGRLKTFLTESPNARQKLPYLLMQEMRISPDLPEYNELLDKLFFELMDGKLQTTEEMKAFLEPYSPPAPPPPVNMRRARARKEARAPRSRGKKAAAANDEMEIAVQGEDIVADEGLIAPEDISAEDRGAEPEEHEELTAEMVAPSPQRTEARKEGKKGASLTLPAKPAALPVSKKAAVKASLTPVRPATKHGSSAKKTAGAVRSTALASKSAAATTPGNTNASGKSAAAPKPVASKNVPVPKAKPQPTTVAKGTKNGVSKAASVKAVQGKKPDAAGAKTTALSKKPVPAKKSVAGKKASPTKPAQGKAPAKKSAPQRLAAKKAAPVPSRATAKKKAAPSKSVAKKAPVKTAKKTAAKSKSKRR